MNDEVVRGLGPNTQRVSMFACALSASVYIEIYTYLCVCILVYIYIVSISVFVHRHVCIYILFDAMRHATRAYDVIQACPPQTVMNSLPKPTL